MPHGFLDKNHNFTTFNMWKALFRWAFFHRKLLVLADTCAVYDCVLWEKFILSNPNFIFKMEGRNEHLFKKALDESKSNLFPTMKEFMTLEKYHYFKTSICLAMDETLGWNTYLLNKNMLVGKDMEKICADLMTKWERSRTGEPTKTIFILFLSNDENFGKESTETFMEKLIALGISDVQAAVIKFQSFIKFKVQNGSVDFEFQSQLRNWIQRNNLIDEIYQNTLIQKLYDSGVRNMSHLSKLDKADWNDVGLNKIQAFDAVSASKNLSK